MSYFSIGDITDVADFPLITQTMKPTASHWHTEHLHACRDTLPWLFSICR
jgi:hypothetical protein